MSIDIGKAAFSGFGLIARRPLSVLVWGLVYLVLLGLPTLFLISQAAPTYMQMIQGMAAAHAAGATPADTNAAMMSSMMSMQKFAALGWLVNILGLVVRGILIAAVMRAVLEPDNKGFFYLRLGGQELWQMLLALAMALIIVLLFFAVFIVAAILAAMMGALGEAAAIGRALVMLVAFVVCIYIVLRLSLAPAMTFGAKTFRLFESWSLTRGHVGALFAIILILIALVIVFEIVVGGGIFAYVMANRDSLRAFAESAHAQADPQAAMQAFMKTMGPIIIGAIAVGSVLSGAALAIFMAPFATVYKQLTADAGAAATPAT